MDVKGSGYGWSVYVRGGRDATGIDAVAWAKEGVERGAGEIMLTSIDRDGTCSGVDCATAASAAAVTVPVIASGGAKTFEDFLNVFEEGAADAALAASIFHTEAQSIGELKQYLASRGVPVRVTA